MTHFCPNIIAYFLKYYFFRKNAKISSFQKLIQNRKVKNRIRSKTENLLTDPSQVWSVLEKDTNLTYATRCFISGWWSICKILVKIQTKITNRTVTFINCKLTIWGWCIGWWVIRISNVRTILTHTCSTGRCCKNTTYTKP